MRALLCIWKDTACHQRKLRKQFIHIRCDNNRFVCSGPASKIIVKFCIAVTCGLIGAVFTFPGLRMARMHWDSLKYCKENKFLQFLLNLSFILPFVLTILWIKPISREFLTNRTFSSMENPLYVFRFSITFPANWTSINIFFLTDSHRKHSISFAYYWLSSLPFYVLLWCQFIFRHI